MSKHTNRFSFANGEYILPYIKNKLKKPKKSTIAFKYIFTYFYTILVSNCERKETSKDKYGSL